MSTLTAVVFALWVLPILAVGIAYVRLSRRVTRELAALTENRAAAHPAEARRLVRIDVPVILDVPLPASHTKSLPRRSDLGASGSGRVNVRALNERRLFAVSAN